MFNCLWRWPQTHLSSELHVPRCVQVCFPSLELLELILVFIAESARERSVIYFPVAGVLAILLCSHFSR